jgi:hypothetical protein
MAQIIEVAIERERSISGRRVEVATVGERYVGEACVGQRYAGADLKP